MVADREYSQCDDWREDSLRRIEAGDPKTATVVMSGDTAYTPYGERRRGAERRRGLRRDGSGLPRDPRRGSTRPACERSVIKDTPTSASDVPSCVSEDLDNLDSCAFPRVADRDREFDSRAARAAPEADLIDVTGEICPRDLCRAVIGNALVYRDKSHLTRDLRPHPRPGARARAEAPRRRLSGPRASRR